MHYCLDCPGPLAGHYGGRCPFCGSANITRAEYCGDRHKWYPVETDFDEDGEETEEWIEGDWDGLEEAREDAEAEALLDDCRDNEFSEDDEMDSVREQWLWGGGR